MYNKETSTNLNKINFRYLTGVFTSMTTSALNTSQYVFAKEVRAGIYNATTLFIFFLPLFFVYLFLSCFL